MKSWECNLPRRAFLKSAGAAVLFGALSPVSSAEAAPRSRMKIGLVTYNLAQDWDVPTLIKNCEAAQFDGVELRTGHAHRVEVNLSREQRKEVKKRFADSKVQLMGLGSAFDFHTADQDKLRRDIEATKQYIVLAHDVGATGVKVRPNGLPKERSANETLQQIGRSLDELGGFAEDYGQVIRLEVHGSGTAHLPFIKKIMDAAPRKNVGVCWNSNQSDLEDGGLDANFELVKERIFSVHMRDLYLEEYPFRRLLQRLNGISFGGYCLAEIPASADPVRVMRYFRGLWLAYQGLL